jgi:prepilin-type N-terminal cleavage/methylation domain-containing protein
MSERRAFSRQRGFTLVETIITTGLLGVMFVITGTVLVRTVGAWRMQEAYTQVSAGLRDATLAISQELEAAATEDDSTLNPPVKGIAVAADGKSVTYQVPSSLDGKTWSKPIQIRLRTEDSNLNLTLDSKEDLDGNGFLDRVIERLEDLDGNGDYSSPGETRIMARGIDSLSFVREKGSRKMAVTVAARYADLSAVKRTQSAKSEFTVVVRN